MVAPNPVLPIVQIVDSNGQLAAGGTGAAANQVQGTSGPGTADDGSNPVKIGMVASNAAPGDLPDGARGTLQSDARQNVFVRPAMGTAPAQDGWGNNAIAMPTSVVNRNSYLLQGTAGWVFNGTSWDRQRGDASGTFMGANLFWTEASTPLAASATINGALRTNGGAAGGVGSRFAFFIAEAFSDVAGGTLYIDKSADGGTTYRQVGSIALTANTCVTLKVPVSAAGYRARVVNGATAQAAALVTSAFSLN